MKRTVAAALMMLAGTASGQVVGEHTGVMVLNPSMSAAASISGQAMVVAHKFEVGSGSNSAIDVNGQGRIECAEIHISGDYNLSGRGQLLGPVWLDADAPEDPIAPRFADGFDFDGLLGMASTGTLATDLGSLESSNGDEIAARPGFYSGGASLSGGTVNLAPGTYIFGGDVQITSHTQLIGRDVTIVLLNGSMTVAGQATVKLDAPQEGMYSGVTILMPPSNSSRISLTGGSGLVVQDAIWAPSGELSVTGSSNSSLEGPIVGSTIVVDSLKAAGRGLVVLGYTEGADMALQPQYD